jgi:hypothetical protein
MTSPEEKAISPNMSGVKHHFSVSVAVEVGVNAAVVLENIAFWVRANRKAGRHKHDGKHWTYGSTRHFAELFDYLSEKQVRGALDKLITCGYVETGNFNRSAYDRTRWFTLTEKGERATQERQSEKPIKAKGAAGNGRPIPDKNKKSKTGYMTDATPGHYRRDPFDF